MLPKQLRVDPRSLEEITRLIEAYPPEFRHWCDAPERGGCACMGCVRHPAPGTVRGDPEGYAWPDERGALTREEVRRYLVSRIGGHRLMNDGVFLPVGTVLTLIVVRDSVWVNEVVSAWDPRRW